jgi:hypothetical protein
MEVKPLQPEKAQVPIELTEPGIVMEVKPAQSKKARLPIEVTPKPISTVTMADR